MKDWCNEKLATIEGKKVVAEFDNGYLDTIPNNLNRIDLILWQTN